MPIQVACSSCNATLKAPDHAAGKKVRCPKCQNELLIPSTGGQEFAPAATMPPPVPNPPAPAVRGNDDDDFEEERRPRRKSGKIPANAPNKMVIGILAIVLGSLGIHKFMLGYTGAGVTMLLVSVCTCFVLSSVMGIIGLVEGIIYLTKSDEEFYETYVVNKKPWF